MKKEILEFIKAREELENRMDSWLMDDSVDLKERFDIYCQYTGDYANENITYEAMLEILQHWTNLF